jgi:hypothetical protein
LAHAAAVVRARAGIRSSTGRDVPRERGRRRRTLGARLGLRVRARRGRSDLLLAGRGALHPRRDRGEGHGARQPGGGSGARGEGAG